MAADDDTVHGHGSAGIDQHGIADPKLIGGSFATRTSAANRDRPGQTSNKSRIARRPRETVMPSSTSATSTKSGDDESGEEL